MHEYLLPYLLLMAHFVSGVFWLYRISRRLDHKEAKQQWVKFISYLLLVNLFWCSIIYFKPIFHYLCWGIVFIALIEIGQVLRNLRNRLWLILIFILISASFLGFARMDQQVLLFTYFVVVLFDGSSQVAGQLIGKRALLPAISPRKTLEGLLGGIFITLASTLIVRQNFAYNWGELIIRTCLLMMAAFTGDLLASAVKRAAGVSTFGKILPGHGGVLDRFDSLMMAGTISFLLAKFQSWMP